MKKESRLKLAIGLSVTFMVIEVVGGILADSLAILSDAAHLLTDIFGFSIALLAVHMAKTVANEDFTYGFARAEILGALASVLTLWIMIAALFYEATIRTINWFNGTAKPIDGKLMFIIACIGVFFNVCLAYLFSEEHGGMFHDHAGHDHSHASKGSCHEAHDVELASNKNLAHNHGHGHSHGHDGHCQHNHTAAIKPVDSGHDHQSHGHSHSHQTDKVKLLPSTSDHTHSHAYGAVKTTNPDTTDHNHQSSIQQRDLNIEAAYLHVIGDLIQSVGVAIAGLVIWFYPSLQLIDPICTYIFTGLVLWTTIGLFKRVILVVFEGTPTHVNWNDVMTELSKIEGVVDVHDLHIWSLSTHAVCLTCHMTAHNPGAALQASQVVCTKFSIHHSTIQVQAPDADGQTCSSVWCNDSKTNMKCVNTPDHFF